MSPKPRIQIKKDFEYKISDQEIISDLLEKNMNLVSRHAVVVLLVSRVLKC
jgi:hypothetical protein